MERVELWVRRENHGQIGKTRKITRKEKRIRTKYMSPFIKLNDNNELLYGAQVISLVHRIISQIM